VKPLVVIDADVLGRRRTGDETYIAALLRELVPLVDQERLAAVTRRPDLVPDGIEPLELPARSQSVRMAYGLPRLLKRLRPALTHFNYVIPPSYRGRSVVTVHDLSFEHMPWLMGRRDRMLFRRFVPASARRADRVLTVSEHAKRDLAEHYGIPDDRVVVTPNGVDPAFGPLRDGRNPASDTVQRAPYALSVGAIQERKNQLAALAAVQEVGLELVVVGPTKDARVAEQLRAGGARLEGYVSTERLAGLYRGAACLVQSSRHEGFGLPVVEAMASGTPVVTVPDPALLEVAGDAAVVVPASELADGIRRALAERDPLSAAGLRRARDFTWEATAHATVRVYLEALGR